MKGETLKKIILICGISQTVITFRLGLIKELQSKGYMVSVIALDDNFKQDIEKNKIDFYCVNSQNRSLNPFEMKKLQREYFAIIKQIQPEIVFTFMLKPNIFGVRASKKAGVKKIFSMVEGLGDVFINNNFKWKIIRLITCKMYRKSFKSVNNVFFLNQDDKDEFIARQLVKEEQCKLISGIGVDTEYFAYKPIKNYRTFLMIARMLKTKGVIEYCKAARIVKQKYPDAIFNYLGSEGNIKVADIQEYIDDGSINYLGTTKDVRPYLEDCSVFVLPSYREGMPMSIMEAEAVGRAIIAANVPGCKHSVNNEFNGFLVDGHNEKQIADKIIFLLENKEKIDEMAKASRSLVCEKFDKNQINAKIMSVLES